MQKNKSSGSVYMQEAFATADPNIQDLNSSNKVPGFLTTVCIQYTLWAIELKL